MNEYEGGQPVNNNDSQKRQADLDLYLKDKGIYEGQLYNWHGTAGSVSC